MENALTSTNVSSSSQVVRGKYTCICSFSSLFIPPLPPPQKKDSLNRKFQTPQNPSIIPITLGVVLCLNSHPIHVFIATLHLYCSHNFIISAFESLGWDFYASYDENLNSLAFFKFSLSCCFCSVHNSHQQNKRTQKYIRVLENRLDKVTFRYISSG